MSQPVTIENDLLRIEVWPHIGGKISSFVDKTDRFELLFNYPAEIPPGAQYDQPYSNGWYAGWDECFPSVAPGKYVGHPYDGIAIPDHGELWGLPTTAVPTRDGITTVWHGLRFGYRLTRKLYLDGPSLVAQYLLINLAPFEFRFVWAMHALMSMISPAQLQIDGSAEYRFDHDAAGNEVHRPFLWPKLDGSNFSRLDQLPAKQAWKLISLSPIEKPATILYPERSRSLRLEYESQDSLKAHWGLWINTGGWAGHRHFAIEPNTGRFDEIGRAIQDNSAGRLSPLGRTAWTVRWTVGP
jgi:hypothetical protein